MGWANPTYQLLPSLAADDYARLRSDIAERGVQVPIVLDENGTVIDGHHRQQIAAELGLDCPSQTRTGLPEHEKRLLAVALNLARRHMTDAQKVRLGMVIEPDAQEAARVRQLAALKQNTTDAPSLGTLGPNGKSRDDVASRVGLGSGRSYERGKKVIQEAERLAPEIVERLDNGQATIREAAHELRQYRKAERVSEIASRPVAEVAGTFPVLYVDPPWRYEHAVSESRQVENNYPTMTADELAALTPPADDDAVIFCWVTSPKLAEGLALLEAWGFDYRTCLVWVKDRIGMGYYFRQQHELLLVGKRGDLPVPDPGDRPSSVVEAPRGDHSAKPEVVYQLIERMYPQYARCEMFARQARDGWTSWGNESEAAS